jgi:hypothetical protein
MRTGRAIVFSLIVLFAMALAVERGDAHKPITSKYTYNDDVFPIFRNKCSRCHVQAGVAPMSLMTYEEAIPWAESIRTELIAGSMPPATADVDFGDIKRAHTLSGKEIDIVLDWATGGNPRGALDEQLPTITLTNEWALGAPDLALTLPTAFTLPAEKMEATQEFTFAGPSESRWVRAVDLLPGTPSIVRNVLIYVKAAGETGSSPTPQRVLARWIPGHEPDSLDQDAAFRLPAGSEIVARIHYKKTWQFEGKPMSDRSTVGIYFSSAKREHEVLPVTLASEPVSLVNNDQTFTFSRTLDEDVEALAVAPDQVPPNVTLRIAASLPDGSRVPLVRFTTKPDWERRYWFERPVLLPRGARIEVSGKFNDQSLMAVALGTPATAAPTASLPVRLTIDVFTPRELPTVR